MSGYTFKQRQGDGQETLGVKEDKEHIRKNSECYLNAGHIMIYIAKALEK